MSNPRPYTIKTIRFESQSYDVIRLHTNCVDFLLLAYYIICIEALRAELNAFNAMKKLKGGRIIIADMQKDDVRSSIEKTKSTKERFTIALSSKSVNLLNEIKEYTEAETTTEVFRDSLRLAYMVMNAQKQGMRLELHNPANPSERPVIIGLGSTLPG